MLTAATPSTSPQGGLVFTGCAMLSAAAETSSHGHGPGQGHAHAHGHSHGAGRDPHVWLDADNGRGWVVQQVTVFWRFARALMPKLRRATAL